MKRVLKNNNGFTLVEIMFTVAIIGLIASIGIPVVLGAMKSAGEKACTANIATIEKAKGMLTLPELVYASGRGLTSGAIFGEEGYTEENLLACMKNVEDLEQFMVGDSYLIPGDIGAKAHYSTTRPAYAQD